MYEIKIFSEYIMDILHIALAIFLFVLSYIFFTQYIGTCGSESFDNQDDYNKALQTLGVNTPDDGPDPDVAPQEKTPGEGELGKDTVYVENSYFPWFKSTRWWNYDGWLYQKP
jgi:hypothetical protein